MAHYIDRLFNALRVQRLEQVVQMRDDIPRWLPTRTPVAAQIHRDHVAIRSSQLDELLIAQAMAGDTMDREQRFAVRIAEVMNIQAHARTLAGWRRKLGESRVRKVFCFCRRDAEEGQHDLDDLVAFFWVGFADELAGALCCHGTDNTLAAELEVVATDDAGGR